MAPTASDDRIGIVGRFDAAPGSWSGIPFGLSRGLSEIGFVPFGVSAEPPARVVRLARRARIRTGRLHPSWEQGAEMMALRELTVRLRLSRVRSRRAVHWVQMGSEFGHPLGGGFVTFEDMTVASARRLPDFLGGPIPHSVGDAWQRRQAAIYQRAAACCTASRWQAASLMNDYGVPREKIHVVGLGWNVAVDVEQRDWSSPRFLFVGLGWKRKNGQAVVSAFKRIRGEWPAATLDVVGDHPPIDEDGVRTHGILRASDPREGRELADLYRHATCFVLPSLYEPFGIVYAEAGRAGLPSVASAVGGSADALGDSGIRVDPRDPAALATAMRTLADPVAAQSAGARARTHAEQLSWRHVAARVVAAMGIDVDEPVTDLVQVS
jgi:glycosyltransferase involved in cell wall biosynthesis